MPYNRQKGCKSAIVNNNTIEESKSIINIADTQKNNYFNLQKGKQKWK